MSQPKSKKARSKKDLQIIHMNELLTNNRTAINDGPSRKKYSIHDIKSIKPMTEPQKEIIESFIMGNNVVATGSAGTGKAQPLYSKILTETGWKTMGELTIGDTVLTPEGNKSKILEIFPQGKKDIYEIVFSDGAKTHACLEHLWECHVPVNLKQRKYSERKIVSTEQIIEILNTKNKHVNISIDLIQPMRYSEKQFSIDPYLLGVLIGDGCFRTKTPSFTSMDDEIVNKIKSIIRDDYKLSKNRLSYNICQKNVIRDGKSFNYYYSELQKLGLQNLLSKDKHIPESYKKSSINQRLELIRGLMDTDGTVDKKSRGISFSTSSKTLATDVQDILWSLGAKCSITEKIPFYYDKDGNKKFGLINYILHISYKNPKELFHLTRKKELCSEKYDILQLRRIIKSVNLIGKHEARCIMIDDPKHLYVTDDYIITHNTYIGLWLALSAILSKEEVQEQLIIVRSAVPTRDIGFLPGSAEEKLEPYEAPYKDIVNELLGGSHAYDNLKEQGKIKFIPTSFLRGLSWDNSIIFIDEIQSCTLHELSTVITRAGMNTRVIAIGDSLQNDLIYKKNDQSGIAQFVNIAKNMKEFDTINFTRNDIVRSQLVKSWICAYEDEMNIR